MSKPGTRSKAEAEMIRELTARGWVRLGRNGMNHERMAWPETGARVLLPSTGPNHFYAKVRKAARGIEGKVAHG